MNHKVLLPVTSLLSTLLMTFHLTSDTLRARGRLRQGAQLSSWCPSWSFGFTERSCSPNGGRGTSSCSSDRSLRWACLSST